MSKSKVSRVVTRRAASPAAVAVPKLCGADFELSNFILGSDSPTGSGAAASQALLREVGGTADRRSTSYNDYGGARRSVWTPAGSDSGWNDNYATAYNPQDWGRKYLLNGGCAYIDLDHFELCSPEVLSARDHVAACHAMLHIGQQALAAANRQRPVERRIVALANNTDGHGHSQGSHLGFLISRDCWERLFHRKFHQLMFLASFQVSNIVLTGQGKVGAENGAPPVAYQLSQRADFFETLVGLQTTYRRPLVNSRDESLCGFGYGRTTPTDALARLHVIFYDHSLCEVPGYLKVGLMQILLAMLELEVPQVNAKLILDDPLDAIVRWSHDPTLQARARLVSGEEVTAVELQRAYWEEMRSFVAGGACAGIVHEADEILALADDTLALLERRDYAALSRRLDWVLKLFLIQRTLRQRPDLNWASPEVKRIDQTYASLDPDEGLYWACRRGGLVDRLIEPQHIEHFVHSPPQDTRAWTRAYLLRRLGTEAVSEVNWDRVSVSLERPGRWPLSRTVHLDNPLGFTRADVEPLIEAAGTTEELLDSLGASAGSVAAAAFVPVHTVDFTWATPEPLSAGGPWVSASVDTNLGLPDQVDPEAAVVPEPKGDDHGSA